MSGECLLCSFCGKPETYVNVMVAGPAVYICNECVDVCIHAIEENTGVKLVREVPSHESFAEFWGTDL